MLVALLVCLIPTTIGALLSAIGIAGMDRMIQKNVIAMSGRAVEAAGDVDVLLLDKTGTITLGNRQATQFVPAPGVNERDLADAAQLASLADETPEGRSIVVLAKEKYGDPRARRREARRHLRAFTAQTRMSGVDLNGRQVRKGAADAIEAHVKRAGGAVPAEVRTIVDRVSKEGATPLVVCDGPRVLGRHPPQGHRQGRHPRALRPAAAHGHQDGHDHRRQPVDGGGHRRRGRRRRLPGRGDAGGEAQADPRHAEQTAGWWP